MRYRFVCVLVVLASSFPTVASSADEPSFRVVRPLLQARCVKCHGPEEQNGDVDFSTFVDDKVAARQRKLWRKSIAQIEAGEMPPADAPQLTAEERDRLLKWMKHSVATVDEADPANRDPGPSLLRRLSVTEYENTIRDLLGFPFQASQAVGMIDETAEGNPFGNLAAALDVSASLNEKYFAAADKILDRLFGVELSSSIEGRIQDKALAAREQLFLLKPGEWRNPRAEIKPPEGMSERDAARAIIGPFLRRAYRGPVAADEVERFMKVYDFAAQREAGYVGSVRLLLKAVLVSPRFLYRIESDRSDVASGEAYRASDHELATRLSYFLWGSMPDDELLDLADRNKLSSDGPSTEPVKMVGRVIGAPESEKHQGNNRDKVFDGDRFTFLDGPDAASYWIGLDLGSPQPIKRLRYAARPGREDRLVGGKFQACDAADFSGDVVELLHIEKKPAGGYIALELEKPLTHRFVRYVPPKNAFGNIAEVEVWCLLEGTVLEQQVRRMLADPKAKALTDDFAARWLQINKLPTARPSTEFFPEFNANVRQAMYDETAMFCETLRRENRSVLELLDADYTFMNEDLAKYYGIPDVTGKELRRIDLQPELHRGGLLGMGSVLALTSHTSRTSPTLRGKWILEVVFGAPPPPPPANVSQIKEEPPMKGKKEITTFREKLAMHANTAACAGCHRKMDPLGFALDNYNAVGLWREKTGDVPLDVSGELPSGEKLNGVGDLKRVLLSRKDEFVRNLAERMLMYALGRELDYYDDGPVQKIAAGLRADDYRYSALIMGVVKSYPFQYRKNSDNKP